MARLLLLLLLAGIAARARAQTQAPGLPTLAVPRCYLGLGAQNDGFQHVVGNSLTELTVPVQASFGYRLRPRLTGQLALTYSRSTFDYGKLSSRQQTAGYDDYGNELRGAG